MNKDQQEQKFKKLLSQWTDVDENIQGNTWKNIEKELFKQQAPKRGWLIAIASILVIGFATFSLFTQPGQAVVQEIKDLFVAEKEEQIELEGDEETTNVKLHTDETLEFVIYVDENSYKTEKTGETTRIVTKEALGENYPEVYMEISQVVGKTKAEIVEQIKEAIDSEKMLIFEEKEVQEPIESLMILGIERDDETDDIRNGWDTRLHNYYILEVSNEQFFMIKQAYFMEASEGHGARFDYMLKSFEVVR